MHSQKLSLLSSFPSRLFHRHDRDHHRGRHDRRRGHRDRRRDHRRGRRGRHLHLEIFTLFLEQ